MTPLSQGGLTRTESDQDHLEFSHPCFVQHRPDLMQQIKRKVRETKQSVRIVEDKQVNEQTQQNLEVVMAEMRSMREKARNMEAKMNSLTKENREIWDQMTSMRQQHARQQQYFKKLLHFLVSVMQPGLSKRVAKRGVLEIDFGVPNTPGSKRNRSEDGSYKDVCDLLESLQRESQEPNSRRFSSAQDCGPLISEVTDEFGNSPGGPRSSDMFSDAFARYAEATSPVSGSREQSPHPIISQPSSNSSLATTQNAKDDKFFKYPEQQYSNQHFKDPSTEPQNVYMGSGPLTTENVHRGGVPTKRNYPSGSSYSAAYGAKPQFQQPVIPQKRVAPYKNANAYNAGQFVSSAAASMPSTSQQNNQQLMRIEGHHLHHHPEDKDTHQDLYSPTLNISPSFDRQISQELQDYFNGCDGQLDNIRDLVSSSNWDNFGENLPDDDDEQLMLHPQHQLALKDVPESVSYGNYEDEVGDLLDPLLSDTQHPENFEVVGDPNYQPLADEEIFPRSPVVLRTPSPVNLK
uniref:HSF-type DNA-binding domain-containing protein n=1 Tax=Caenorhabditis japonica TaxID=281687 RepID=A0A8R1HVJ4_CAEJA